MAERVAEAGETDQQTPVLAPDSHRSSTILSVQIARFVAAFAVTLFHSHGAILLQFGISSEEAAAGLWKVGASGVHIFFVISGFVMVLTSYRDGQPILPQTFLKRRFLRIYPIYWVLASVYLTAHLAMGTPYSLSGGEIARALALYSSDASLIIGPGWTLAYEVYFYLCFAVCLLFGMTRGLVILTGFFVASVAAGMAFPAAKAFHLATNGLLLEFILGCWAGYAFLNRREMFGWVGWPGLVIGTVLLIASAWLPEKVPAVAAWGVPSLLIVAGAISLERHLRGPIARAFALLGDSSYFLYLSHILLLDVFILIFASNVGMSAGAVTAMAVAFAVGCVVISHAGHLLIEAPMLRVLNRLLKRRRQPAASLRSA